MYVHPLPPLPLCLGCLPAGYCFHPVNTVAGCANQPQHHTVRLASGESCCFSFCQAVVLYAYLFQG